MMATNPNAEGRGDWRRDGWCVVEDVLGEAELEDLRREAERLCADTRSFADRGMVPISPRRLDRLDPVIDLSPPFHVLARDPRLLAAAREVLGDEPQLFKDKFIAKPPGAAGYCAHQDGAYWQDFGLSPADFLTIVCFLDDCTAENGAIECASGLHSALLTEPGVIADVDEASLSCAFTIIEARAGDVLLLHSLTPHRSGPNRSRGMRRALLFTYAVDSRPDLYGRYQAWKAALSSPPQ